MNTVLKVMFNILTVTDKKPSRLISLTWTTIPLTEQYLSDAFITTKIVKTCPVEFSVTSTVIGTNILGSVIGASAGIPVGIDPNTVSDLITQNCWSFGSNLATVKVLVNNEEIAAPQLELNDKEITRHRSDTTDKRPIRFGIKIL